ncbi:MAG: hypothetical protein LQ346_002592 [Caloplaca aetnensis]|nr:MAG: hypothetical protein LQ346_002592 [Caloplaca aetnensis]
MSFIADLRPSFLLFKHSPRQMYPFFGSEFFDFESTRILGTAPFGGCEPGEFLEAIAKIKRHDAESWYAAWIEQAERVEVIAKKAADDGQLGQAKTAWLRMSNYLRASSYMLPPDDTRVLQCAERSIQSFRRAIPFMDGQVVTLDVPYEDGKTLAAYLFLPPASRKLRDRKTPVLINCGGADSTQEELYFIYGVSGPDLGYAVLTFDGPGQGMALKRDNIPMRPDFESVVTRMVDHLSDVANEKPNLGLDLNRIAVAGVTMGGYYALRGAIDSRVRACVSVDPFYSLWALALTRMPQWYADLWSGGWISERVFNWSIYTHMRVDFPSRWEFSLGSRMMGTQTPGETLRRFQLFSLDNIEGGGTVLDRVNCPVFITGAAKTIYASAESSTTLIHKKLTRVPETDKEIWIPEQSGQGGLTGKVGAWGALAQRTFGFLDRCFDVKRVPLGGKSI